MSYLRFVPIPKPPERKTPQWWVRNTTQDAILGQIRFKPAWRKFTFQQAGPGIEFDAGCLQEIADFLISETRRWQTEKAGL